MGTSSSGMQSIKYNHGQRKKKTYFSNRKDKINNGEPVGLSYKNLEKAKHFFKLTKERKALMFRKGKVQALIFLSGVVAITLLCYLLLN